MAGYLFGLDSIETLYSCISRGVYSTVISVPSKLKGGKGIWKIPQEGTFADYASMQAGDNVYFFIKRKIYGVGKLVEIAGVDCKFCNFPGASEPELHAYKSVKRKLLLEDEWEEDKTQRWLCTFEPNPYFFGEGADMDDVLASNPEDFKMLRVFWKLSFIKMDDVENQALMDFILRSNQDELSKSDKDKKVFSFSGAKHDDIGEKVAHGEYALDVGPILSAAHNGGDISHEMAVEAAIIFQLSSQIEATTDVFGRWDYLSHQVVASPFKPVDYMDKIDIFGYSYIPNYKPTVSKYLVMEIKNDAAQEKDVDQLMKYVDWVRNEYCHGDYSMIEAYLVAPSFEGQISERVNEAAIRKYVVGTRPAISKSWKNLKLVSYSYNEVSQLLDFDIHNQL